MIYPVHKMTPQMPAASGDLSDLALDVYRKSASLGARLHPITRKALVEFLRLTNSYYSNLIEGHYTHPVDIERAFKDDYAADPAGRNRQMEARVHVEVQKIIESKSEAGEVRVCTSDFICLIHRLFYKRLPKAFWVVHNEETGKEQEVEPGHFRQASVKIGRHIPPAPEEIAGLMRRFVEIYALEFHQGTNRLLAAAASHHRLAWIHPFLDGNGRVTRLFTDCYMIHAGMGGYGLWTISRGFARHRDSYFQNLADADVPGQGDVNGRGFLTQQGLDRFCRFFLETCMDQITFMGSLLDIDGMLDRLQGYIELRNRKMIPGVLPIKSEAFFLLREAFLAGEFARGEAARITGLGERTARKVLRQLTDEGLLVSDTPKAPVRLAFSAATATYWLPDLI
ncbi:MAG: Fic family protein [Proteobacteria bacterium]|nr:Fic family protein [Pseudomonadota bacterium]